MKKFIVLTLVSSALFLGGCTTTSLPSLSTVSQYTVQDVEKASTAAHSLHDATALTASAAAKTGACVKTCAVNVKNYLDLSEKYINEADTIADPTAAMAEINAALTLINSAKGLVS